MLGFSADFATWQRLSTIAVQRGISLESLIPEILESGMKSLEDHSYTGEQKKRVVKVPNFKARDFVRNNYQKMSDGQMADELNLARGTIQQYRYVMRLKRKKTTNLLRNSSLTELQKVFIRDNLFLGQYHLVFCLDVSNKSISTYRMDVLKEYLEKDGRSESVVSTAIRFGIQPRQISVLRSRLNLPRPKRAISSTILRLGNKEDVVYALTRGGKEIHEIAKESGVTVSRQAIHQFCVGHFQINVQDLKKNRTHEWYARRMAGGRQELLKKLLDKDYLEKKLAFVPISVLAAELGLIQSKLNSYLLDRLCIDKQLAIGDVKLVQLTCANPKCDKSGRLFSRKTRTVRRNREKNPNRLDFCSRKCFGQYMGNTSGFVGHPENIQKGIEAIRQKHPL